MIFNATNIKSLRCPSAHLSVGRYFHFNFMAAKLMSINGDTKISFKIEDGEMLIYHDQNEGVIPVKTKVGYRINSKELVNFLMKETGDNKPTFEIIKIQKDTFEMKLKPKPEL